MRGLVRLAAVGFILCGALFVPLQVRADGLAPVAFSTTRTLRVVLYPYIPDAAAAYLAIEQAFEQRHPDVKLTIVSNADTYYSKPEDGGILSSTADVYEVDSVLLADFVGARKIRPLRSKFEAALGQLVPFSRKVVAVGGKTIGMPHWLCGNFLMFRRGDEQLAKVGRLVDLESALHAAAPGPQQQLIIDFFGKSTLGEMYLDAALDRSGDADKVVADIDPAKLDPAVVGDLRRALDLDVPTFGRDHDYHYATGFYPRRFAHNASRAFVGYSESLFYILSETATNCRHEEKCLEPDNIQISDWASDDGGSHPVAWVDTLVIDASAEGQTLADAEHFIQFMSEPSTYKMLLLPPPGGAPRYLLPAREDVYADPDLLRAAPLYSAFHDRLQNASAVTAVGLNEKLRDIGARLGSLLPSH